MRMIGKTVAPLVVALAVVLAGSWASAQESDLPPCPEDQNQGWHNCIGTYTTLDGNEYVGEWRDAQITGQGTFYLANGDKYVGEYRDDKFHGQGTYSLADGRVAEGIWKDGELQ